MPETESHKRAKAKAAIVEFLNVFSIPRLRGAVKRRTACLFSKMKHNTIINNCSFSLAKKRSPLVDSFFIL